MLVIQTLRQADEKASAFFLFLAIRMKVTAINNRNLGRIGNLGKIAELGFILIAAKASDR